MDIWAFCRPCERWYYPDPGSLRRLVPPCPVCISVPDILEDRATPFGAPQSLEPSPWDPVAND